MIQPKFVAGPNSQTRGITEQRGQNSTATCLVRPSDLLKRPFLAPMVTFSCRWKGRSAAIYPKYNNNIKLIHYHVLFCSGCCGESDTLHINHVRSAASLVGFRQVYTLDLDFGSCFFRPPFFFSTLFLLNLLILLYE